MELDILLRGQSNAYLMVGNEFGGAGGRTLVTEVERLLGFDGRADQVHLLANTYTPGEKTISGETAFVGDWVGKGTDSAWQVLPPEQELLTYITRHAHPLATETAILWLHSEYDTWRDRDLTATEWESAVRADAGWVRQALGKDAAHSPYAFVSAIPFRDASDTVTEAIRQGMEDLAADPSFNALVGAHALDVDMNYTFPHEVRRGEYGLAHMSRQDTVQTALRLARALAEKWAVYARPGSPVALAGGDIDATGPCVVSATAQDARTLLVGVAQDHSAGFAPLDAQAAEGIGWTVRTWRRVISADRVEVLAPDRLRIHFAADLPADGVLCYGYGHRRLAPDNQPGEGNGIYDRDGMPLWAPANYVRITPAPSLARVAAPARTAMRFLGAATAPVARTGGQAPGLAEAIAAAQDAGPSGFAFRAPP
ncbi:conserved protein of unknown function [Rhodovastum atsumiense]|uniref:Uncharacterized protein n=1 Tax=Rhodovastum atsumiense TaxID=504468 RepID=A0A5M6IYG9_9PROT|nr:hypothetical protein [Rhodovastum atsumiense]KAA5613390.1 hypothetical protein F1189_04835 [Rhodovastum atsumiense]CAH2603080.1 conserved protein of unknown function [Rhodovastum atsumiense]